MGFKQVVFYGETRHHSKIIGVELHPFKPWILSWHEQGQLLIWDYKAGEIIWSETLLDKTSSKPLSIRHALFFDKRTVDHRLLLSRTQPHNRANAAVETLLQQIAANKALPCLSEMTPTPPAPFPFPLPSAPSSLTLSLAQLSAASAPSGPPSASPASVHPSNAPIPPSSSPSSSSSSSSSSAPSSTATMTTSTSSSSSSSSPSATHHSSSSTAPSASNSSSSSLSPSPSAPSPSSSSSPSPSPSMIHPSPSPSMIHPSPSPSNAFSSHLAAPSAPLGAGSPSVPSSSSSSSSSNLPAIGLSPAPISSSSSSTSSAGPSALSPLADGPPFLPDGPYTGACSSYLGGGAVRSPPSHQLCGSQGYWEGGNRPSELDRMVASFACHWIVVLTESGPLLLDYMSGTRFPVELPPSSSAAGKNQSCPPPSCVEILGTGCSRMLAFGCPDGLIRIWDTETNTQVGLLGDPKLRSGVVRLLSWEHANSIFLISAAADGCLYMWSVSISGMFALNLLKKVPKVHSAEMVFAFNPVERILFTIDYEEKGASYCLWDIYHLQPFSKKKVPQSIQFAASFHHPAHHCNTILLSPVSDSTLYLLDAMDERKDIKLLPILDTNALPGPTSSSSSSSSSARSKIFAFAVHPLQPHLVLCAARAGLYIISMYPTLSVWPCVNSLCSRIFLPEREKFHILETQLEPPKVLRTSSLHPKVKVSIRDPHSCLISLSPTGQFMLIHDTLSREFQLLQQGGSPDQWDNLVDKGLALTCQWALGSTDTLVLVSAKSSQDQASARKKKTKSSGKKKNKNEASGGEGEFALSFFTATTSGLVETHQIPLPPFKTIRVHPSPRSYLILTISSVNTADPSFIENSIVFSKHANTDLADSAISSPLSSSCDPSCTDSVSYHMLMTSPLAKDFSSPLPLREMPSALVWDASLSLCAIIFSSSLSIIQLQDHHPVVIRKYHLIVCGALWFQNALFCTTPSQVLLLFPSLDTRWEVMELTSFDAVAIAPADCRFPNIPKVTAEDLDASSDGSPEDSSRKDSKRFSFMGTPKQSSSAKPRSRTTSRPTSMMLPVLNLQPTPCGHNDKVRPLERMFPLKFDPRTSILTLSTLSLEPSLFTISLADNWLARTFLYMAAGALSDAVHAFEQLSAADRNASISVFSSLLASHAQLSESLAMLPLSETALRLAIKFSDYSQCFRILSGISQNRLRARHAVIPEDPSGWQQPPSSFSLSLANSLPHGEENAKAFLDQLIQVGNHPLHQWCLMVSQKAISDNDLVNAERLLRLAELIDPSDQSVRALISFYVFNKNFEALEALYHRLVADGEKENAQFASMFLEDPLFTQSLEQVAFPSYSTAFFHHFSASLPDSPEAQSMASKLQESLVLWNQQLQTIH